MKKKIISFVVAEEDVERTIASNKLLIESLIELFSDVYILNLYNLKILTKKKIFQNSKKISDGLIVINFKDSREFEKFCSHNQIVSIAILGKDLSFFKIYYLLKKYKFKLIMVMNLSQIGNKMTVDINLKYLFKAYKNYFYKGFYHIFRILTILKIFPKINLLFESNLEVIKYIENSRSKKIEKFFPFLKLSYFEKVVPVNSIYFDNINLFPTNINSQNNCILYVDTHFDHPDRTSREGPVNKNYQNIFYSNLNIFLNKISLLYKKKVIISKHPGNKSYHEFYSSFEISKISTSEAIFESDIVIFTLSSAILNAVILKKKIIQIKSTLLGEYMQNISGQYAKLLGLVTFDVDKNYMLSKEALDIQLKKSIENYTTYINNKLTLDGNNSSSAKIALTIRNKFF